MIKLAKKLVLDNADFTFKDGKIEVKLKINTPKKLYKYYAFNKNSVSSFENETFHFSHINLLNDIMDGNFPIKWDLNEFIEKMIDEKQLPVNKSNKEYYKKIVEQEFHQKTLQYLGVFSTCNNLENELLWIHYTNEKGFAIEIDYELLEKNLSENYRVVRFPVSYRNIEKINFYDYCYKEKNKSLGKAKGNYNLNIIACLAEKETFWSYENEWRFVLWHKKFNNFSSPTVMIDEDQRKNEIERLSSRNLKINPDIIKRVILGCQFFNNYRFKQIEYSDSINDNYVLFYVFNNEKEISFRFFKKLKEKYNDNIFQIDKVYENNVVKRKLSKKIEIVDVFESSVKIKVSQIK